MNGGPSFSLNEAFSLVVSCQDQAEVDYYWSPSVTAVNRDRAAG